MVHARRVARAGMAAPWILILGCATTRGPSYDSMRSEVDAARVVDDDGDRVLSGPVLDRNGYVAAVMRHNPSIESARSGFRAAVARVRASGALEDPMVTLQVAPLSIGSSTARLGYDAMISQKLPWPGKLGLDESVARAEADAAKGDFEAARGELALTAAILYDDYFVATRSLEINAQHLALMKELKAAALAQLESGRGSGQDPLAAEAELAHMEHDTVILASQRDITVAEMNELLHRDPELPLPPPTNDLVLPDAPNAADAKKLVLEALAKRPEIEAARMRARAEQARGERAARDSYPDLTVSTSYNSMWDMPEHRWMVGLGLNVPIQTSRRAGGVEAADAARAKYESDVASLRDKARTEVVVALKRLDEAHHVAKLFEERLLPIARDRVDAARAGFIASRNDFVAVIAAEKSLRGEELAYEMARADVDRRRTELDHALGRIGLHDEKGAR